MRRIGARIVFSCVGVLIAAAISGPVPASDPGSEVRIFGSLEEAVPGSGGPLVLVFFSLDCPVCWEELFEVRYLIAKNGMPIDIIGISADARDELEPFLDKHAYYSPVVADGRRELYRRFRVRLEPAVVVLEAGRVLYRDDDSDDLDTRRDKLRRCLLEIAARRPAR